MAKSSSAAIAGLAYLQRPEKYPPKPICALFGDEPFLKSAIIAQLKAAVLTDDDGDLSFRAFVGDDADPRDVFDELSTVALFGAGRRLALVTEADDFVSEHRHSLEDYADRPSQTGVLVLEVKTWPSNTKLYKKVAESGLNIDCSAPKESTLLDWISDRAQQQYNVTFAPGAADRLMQIVGPQMGRLDQETAKLANLVASESLVAPESAGDQSRVATGPTSVTAPAPATRRGLKASAPTGITIQLVEDVVGGWRAKKAWDMIDAAVEGNAAEALVQLDRLLLSGENPIALMGQMASSLRKFAAAARIVNQSQSAGRRINIRQALEQAGFKNWSGMMDKAESQIRQLGARRAGQLYRWLLEADLALKGSSSSGDRARLVLEQLIVRMSKQLA